jgi:hypothetical protein
LDLGEATTFFLIILSMISHKGCIQNSFFPKLRVPKFSKLGLLALWRPITYRVDLRLTWGLKQSCNSCQELSNNMWHATRMHVFQSNSWLLMVRNQIDILIPDLSFGHNLCFKYSNGSCEPILDIQVSRTFQWHKGIFNSMKFDPRNHSLKI